MFPNSDGNTKIALSIFNISHDTTLDEIKKKYKLLCIKYHPDKYTDSLGRELGNDAMKCINKKPI